MFNHGNLRICRRDVAHRYHVDQRPLGIVGVPLVERMKPHCLPHGRFGIVDARRVEAEHRRQLANRRRNGQQCARLRRLQHAFRLTPGLLRVGAIRRQVIRPQQGDVRLREHEGEVRPV